MKRPGLHTLIQCKFLVLIKRLEVYHNLELSKVTNQYLFICIVNRVQQDVQVRIGISIETRNKRHVPHLIEVLRVPNRRRVSGLSTLVKVN